MAIKFEDKAEADKVRRPQAVGSKSASEPAETPGMSPTPEPTLPFGKAAKPEKKKRGR